MIHPPYKHQREEYEEHVGDKSRAYFWQMRTGKSKMAIDNSCYLAKNDFIDGVIILAPNGVHLNWIKTEITAHHWSEISHEALAWQFSKEDMADRFNTFLSDCSLAEMGYLAINLESMTRNEIKNALRRFERLHPRFMLICDEAHHFRRPGAKRTARARAIARRATYVRTLSGSSLDNSALHAFSQFELLDKAALGFDRYEDFKEHFAVFKQLRARGGRKFEKLDHYKNLDELKELMAPYVSVVLRSDCEDLPDVIPAIRYIEPTTRQLSLYRAIQKADMQELEQYNLWDAIQGGVKLNKFQQVLSGFLYQDDGSVIHLPGGNPRLDALLEEIELHDGKVLVWCRFTQDILNIRDALKKQGVRTAEYHGKISDTAREEGKELFASDPEVKVMIGQPQAGGEGLDFSAASKIVWYSHTPDNIVRTQADERATKIGGEHIQLVDLVVESSVDEYFMGILAEKRSVADDISRTGLREIIEKVSL